MTVSWGSGRGYVPNQQANQAPVPSYYSSCASAQPCRRESQRRGQTAKRRGPARGCRALTGRRGSSASRRRGRGRRKDLEKGECLSIIVRSLGNLVLQPSQKDAAVGGLLLTVHLGDEIGQVQRADEREVADVGGEQDLLLVGRCTQVELADLSAYLRSPLPPVLCEDCIEKLQHTRQIGRATIFDGRAIRGGRAGSFGHGRRQCGINDGLCWIRPGLVRAKVVYRGKTIPEKNWVC